MGSACGTCEGEQRRIPGCGGEPEERVPLGTLWYIMEDNIRKGFQEIEWDGVNWFDLAQDRDKW
jgi:hypothetical protein